MKKLTLVLSILVVTGCAVEGGNAPQTDDGTGRFVVNSSSSRADMRQEARQIEDGIASLNSKFEDVTRLCDEVDERAAAFNEILAGRESAIASYQESRQQFLDQLEPLVRQLDEASRNYATYKGQYDGLTKQINFLSSPSTLKDRVRAERKTLSAQLRQAKRDLNSALRSLKSASLGTPAFDQATAQVTAAKTVIGSAEGQLKVLTTTMSSNIAAEIEIKKTERAGLDAFVQAASRDITNVSNQISPIRSQINNLTAQINAISMTDNLKPVVVPAVCSQLAR